MALVLFTSDGQPHLGAYSSEPKSAEKLKVECNPLPHHLGYKGKLIAARSDKFYSCIDKSRETTWKEDRKRHLHQLKECGFKSNICEPYKDLGEVILDDNRLILEGLGQAVKKDKDKDLKDSETLLSSASFSSVVPPEKMLSLHEKVCEGNLRLNEMRKGKSLSMVMTKEEKKKQLEKEADLKEHNDTKKKRWVRATDELVSQTLLHESATTSLSGFPVATEGDFPTSVEATALDSSGFSSKSSIGDPSLHQSHVSSRRRDSQTQKNELLPDFESHSTSQMVVDSWLDSKRDDTLRKQHIFAEFTVERWYRKLSVMVWILETMRAEEPHLCNPFAICWKTNHRDMKPSAALNVYEEGIENLRRWFYFERKASRKGKRGCGGIDQTMSAQDAVISTNETQMMPRASGLWNLKSTQPSPSEVMLDVQSVREEFNNVQKEHGRIVHEQLKAMDRDRTRGAKERICSLNITGNLHKDLKRMRKGVTTESTETARKRLFVNLEWFKELVDSLPPSVKGNIYCQHLLIRLEGLSTYINYFTDKMSKKRLLAVLETLQSWQLVSPDVDPAIRHIITKVIYVTEQEYETWFKEYAKARSIDDVRAISKEGYKLPVL